MTLQRTEDLLSALSAGTPMEDRLVITPMLDRDRQIGPASVDLRLGSDFLIARRAEGSGIDPADTDLRAIANRKEAGTHNRALR